MKRKKSKRHAPNSRPHTINQRVHAKRRAAERYGIELNRFELAELSERLATGNGLQLQRQNDAKAVYLVDVKGVDVVVVYSRKTRQPATFLPREWLDSWFDDLEPRLAEVELLVGPTVVADVARLRHSWQAATGHEMLSRDFRVLSVGRMM